MAVPIERVRAQWRAANRRYRKRHPERGRERRKQYSKAWRLRNPEKAKAADMRWRLANPDRVKESARIAGKKWRANNLERAKAMCARWQRSNREYVNRKERERCAADPSYRLARCLRSRIRRVLRLRAATKRDNTAALTGCSVQFLMGHLEARFQPGMSWDNYGNVWEVDHIFPCAMYDLAVDSQQRACFHYTNLQPLFVSDNRRKYTKLPKVPLCQ
jgi:hypothetical protein